MIISVVFQILSTLDSFTIVNSDPDNIEAKAILGASLFATV